MKNSPKDIRDLHQQAGPKTKAIIEENIVPMKGSETGKKKTTKEQTCSTSPPVGNSRAFDPDTIFYATETGAYFVDVGTHYRAYQRKTPIKAGIRRHLERQGTSENDIGDLLAMHIDNIELDRAADWVGGLAGHNRGLMTHQGRSFLITTEPDIPVSAKGKCPLHLSVIAQAFPTQDARTVFLAWLASGNPRNPHARTPARSHARHGWQSRSWKVPPRPHQQASNGRTNREPHDGMDRETSLE